MNGLIKFALSLANVPSDLVAEVEADIPGAQRLIEAARKIQPDLQKLDPIITKLMPLLVQALPLLEEGAPIVQRILPVIRAEQKDIADLLPTIQRVLAFVDDRKH